MARDPCPTRPGGAGRTGMHQVFLNSPKWNLCRLPQGVG